MEKVGKRDRESGVDREESQLGKNGEHPVDVVLTRTLLKKAPSK